MGLGPVGLAGVGDAVAEQEHAELLLGAGEGFGGVGAGAAQIADRLVLGLWDVDGLKFAGAQEPGEFAGVALVGLFDPLTILAGHLGGRHHDAVVAELEESAGEDKPGGTGLIGDADLVFLDAEFLAEFDQSALGAEGGAAPLAVVLGRRAVSASGGDDDGVFVDVESDMEFDFHGVSWVGILRTGLIICDLPHVG